MRDSGVFAAEGTATYAATAPEPLGRGVHAASTIGGFPAAGLSPARAIRSVRRHKCRTPLALLLSVVLTAWVAGAGVLKIELPPERLAFKPGPGAEIANGQCLVCHSVDYVVMQPPMPRPFWAASVKKMREKFGAALPEDQVEAVVNYLTQTYGVETNVVASAAPPAGGAPGVPVGSAGASTGEALATRYGCLGCHNVTTKIVGPAYLEVAKKYRGDAGAFAKIAQQIHQGGSGKWGPALMPPFPMISDAETKALAEWILSRQ
jgi:cytochrome c551/c552